MADYTVTEKTGTAIQAAVDAAHNAGGGRVCLEPGVYLSGTICLKSNVELHLPAGAEIKGYSNPEQYDDFRDPGFDNVSPEGSRKCLIAAAHAENVSITGMGEINGSGPDFYDTAVPAGATFAKPPHPRPRMVQFFDCRNVLFEGVSFVDSPGWTFWLLGCDDVHVSRIRVTGCQQMINNDGIDIDDCRRVTVSDSFFRCAQSAVRQITMPSAKTSRSPTARWTAGARESASAARATTQSAAALSATSRSRAAAMESTSTTRCAISARDAPVILTCVT